MRILDPADVARVRRMLTLIGVTECQQDQAIAAMREGRSAREAVEAAAIRPKAHASAHGGLQVPRGRA
jgi:hypothetical protein